MNKLAVFDADGTVLSHFASWRHLHQVLGTEERAGPVRTAYYAGQIDYVAWARQEAALWTGIPRQKMEEAVPLNPLRRGAKELVEGFRTRGFDLLMISAGLDLYNGPACRALGIPTYISTGLVFDDRGFFTGQIEQRVTDHTKGLVLETYLAESAKPYDYVFAVGDGENDIPLFERANASLAVCPMTEKVRAAARYVIDEEPIDRAWEEIQF